MKLGFAINCASAGLTTELECNKGKWTNKVIDIREYLKMFSGLTDPSKSYQEPTGNKLTFLSFDEDGCMLTIAKPIPGRWGDFRACWIYIPNTVIIDGEQIVNIHRFVSGIMDDESNITSRKEEIEEFFSQSYPDRDKWAKNVPSSGDKFGMRYIDRKYQLADLLGNNRYQQYYSKYRAIFLISRSEEVKPTVNLFEDLTDQSLHTYKIVEAPNLKELSALGKNTELYFENGVRFDKDFNLPEDLELNLVAKRRGFEDIKLTVSVTEWNQKVIFSKPLDWKIKLGMAKFRVSNSNGETIYDIKVWINEKTLSNNSAIYIPESEARNIAYTVKAPGYEEYSGSVDLSQGVRPIEITLHREVRSEISKIVLRDDTVADMTLKARGMDFSGRSPLKGYSYNHERDAYSLDWWFVFKQRLIGILYAVVFVVCFLLYFAIDAWLDSHEFGGSFPWIHEKSKQEVVSEEYNPEDGPELTRSDSLAVMYLDKNEVWSKDSLETYDLTRDIYDDMNAFLFDDFTEKHSKAVNASKKMKEVSEAIKKSRDEGIDPKINKEEGKYNKDNDTEITVSRYIDWITTNHFSSSASGSDSFGADNAENEERAETSQSRITGRNGNSAKHTSRKIKSENEDKTLQNQQPINTPKTEKPKRGETKK
ncbi:hypothetical protein [uncultured Bacteroides sp.]|uniref:hypothetical protein n=1 Tax=uncultured Bacteroides sp. TaxID=162156 RepID=UPI00263632B2|nr:hypothetical protein [uncultured Bacteroides sp.]